MSYFSAPDPVIDFIVTGSMRSGTTYMASILNSQGSMTCLEDKPWELINRVPRSVEHFSKFCASLEAKFTYLGIPAPNVRNIRSFSEVYPVYCQHFRDLFDCDFLGFKSTMMNLSDIKAHAQKGVKVILMRRDVEKILRSWVGRISPSLKSAEYSLSKYLRSINNYDIPAELGSSLCVIDYEHLASDPEGCLGKVSTFLGKNVSIPDVRYHSFNKNRFPFDRNNSSTLLSNDFDESLLVSKLPRLYTEKDYKLSAKRVEKGLSVAKIVEYEIKDSIEKLALKIYRAR